MYRMNICICPEYSNWLYKYG